ncbi:MAG: hypothetical protein PUC47_05580 [Oscillospiraceae bacterium]|nr:hypothetical protein [Oscillospiraceae bacterium]
MSFSDKMDACQEVENRYAAANGVSPCRVTARPMIGGCYGEQSGSTICLNAYLMQGNYFLTEDVDQQGNDILVRTPVSAANWNVLDTMFHEGTHGIQVAQGRAAATYISPEQDMDLYRIQHDEKEAFAAGQFNTLQAIDAVQKASGQIDPQTADYLTTVRNDSFQAALQCAATNYNDPDIEKTLAQVIYDRDHGIQRSSPSPSYTAINALCDSYNLGQSRTGSAQTPDIVSLPDAGQQHTEGQNPTGQDTSGLQTTGIGMNNSTGVLSNDGAGLNNTTGVPSDDGASLNNGTTGLNIDGTGMVDGGSGLNGGAVLADDSAGLNDTAEMMDDGADLNGGSTETMGGGITGIGISDDGSGLDGGTGGMSDDGAGLSSNTTGMSDDGSSLGSGMSDDGSGLGGGMDGADGGRDMD